jgi:hypothetical protein
MVQTQRKIDNGRPQIKIEICVFYLSRELAREGKMFLIVI